MTIDGLKKKLKAGRCEVEDIIDFAIKSRGGDAQPLRELSAQRAIDEKSAAADGRKSFPLGRWLSVAAVFVEKGYEGLSSEVAASAKSLPFALAFAVEDRQSPESWAFFADIIEKHGDSFPEANSTQLIEAINRAFSFGKTVPPDAEGVATIHGYVLGKLLAGQQSALALCAARGFPSQAMLDAVTAAPEPKGEWKDAKAAAIARIRAALKKAT